MNISDYATKPILNKEFCEEYQFLSNLKHYFFYAQEKCGYFPFIINNLLDENTIFVYYLHNAKYKKSIEFSIFNTSKAVLSTIVIEDSGSIPQHVLGKKLP